ncbi:IMPACT family protein [Alloscardovia macacae]|uniref:IMPACT family protein n=1 Tax=Alloscardovia macacae TaxID=1160091 RepID=A0A1Y2T0M5_9BIFI|nr:YigZ family protein [Alloscardovia macacae]OTA27293.1 IMPACT family protein [Alloscardovia macacae]OTA29303.1 IMPACT family protein [Alloscardovia macacae]
MQTVVNPASAPARFTLVEKKSEFLSAACHISSLDEAVAFVEQVRAEHPKARHVCFAAILGASEAQFQERMSDDGEPSGTAGRPILQVLRQSGTTDTVIAVTRYFGGILLGAGGLVRAYSTAASEALKLADMGSVIVAQHYTCTVEYAQHALLTRVIGQCGGRIDTENFAERVTVHCTLPLTKADEFEHAVEQTFQASVTPERGALGSLME